MKLRSFALCQEAWGPLSRLATQQEIDQQLSVRLEPFLALSQSLPPISTFPDLRYLHLPSFQGYSLLLEFRENQDCSLQIFRTILLS